MLTFDRPYPGGNVEEIGLAELLNSRPDLVEIGENETYWVQIRRSTRTLELISKQTGAIVTSVKDIDKVGVELSSQELDLLGLSRLQNGVIKAVARQLRKERKA